MNASAALSKQNLAPEALELNINDLVQSASQSIAPLWPIGTFAARNPWAGLEGQTFEQVARRLKDAREVDILPSAAMIRAAMDKGEIDQSFLEMGLRSWLDSQSFRFPRELAEQFCRAALHLDELPSSLLVASEVKRLAQKLSGIKPDHSPKNVVKPVSLILQQQGGEKLAETLNFHLIKWCKLFLDDATSAWSLPHREKGFYRSWRSLIQHDPALSPSQRKLLKSWPHEASAALTQGLAALEIPQQEIQDYLEAHLLSLPGWAGMMLWRSNQSLQESSLLMEYLAVRISMEWVLTKPYLPIQKTEETESLIPLIAAWIHWGKMPVEKWHQYPAAIQKEFLTLASRFDEMARRKLWLEAWEETYADQLSEKITSKKHEIDRKNQALAQFVFCLDVRSEPFRRQLEKAGPFETHGMAGFFGLPIETRGLGHDHSHPSLPVILKPQHHIKEISSSSENYLQRQNASESLHYTFQTMKQNLPTSLLLPEISGPWLSLKMLARTLLPRGTGRIFRKLMEEWLDKPAADFTLERSGHSSETELPIGFSKEEKVHYVRQALKLMGLTKDFAPLVVICGHESHSTNNPYSAALDCGACGGASGEFNARVLAALCNLKEVRLALKEDGIFIPEDTVFAAAKHITTVDELNWLYVPELSEASQRAFDSVQAVLPEVSRHANAARLSQLPHVSSRLTDPKMAAERLAEDWSEVRPEWGLARNGAFIIGSRKLTKDCDLEGRVFLHDYDWQKDGNGDILANIISGPGTVTQWINLQYYASTVAPHYYGSGNKATQTVTSGLGVMQGNASDLLAGLPWQSVMKSDDEVYHSPLRLLIVIQAPWMHVKRLLDRDPAFRQKVKNGWVRLATIDSAGYWESRS